MHKPKPTQNPEDRSPQEDIKSIAEGVKAGLSNQKSVDLNRASRDELGLVASPLPSRGRPRIAERPLGESASIVTRHIVSEEQYSQNQDRAVANR